MTGQPMARPFPQPGPLVGLAYRELQQAANGTLDQILAPRRLFMSCRGRGNRNLARRSCAARSGPGSTEVVDWLNTDYCWDPDGLIPACWPHHPHLVHEIAMLADQRRIAGQAFTSDLLEEWHRYTLPSFHDRLRSRIRSHCDDSHQPWPAKGRHTRYRDGADDRVPAVRRRPPFRAAAKVCRGLTAQLALIDLTTGEVVT